MRNATSKLFKWKKDGTLRSSWSSAVDRVEQEKDSVSQQASILRANEISQETDGVSVADRAKQYLSAVSRHKQLNETPFAPFNLTKFLQFTIGK